MSSLSVRDAYRLWSPSYDAENAVTTLEDAAVRALTPACDGVLLDAGCGTGRRMPAAGRSFGCDLVTEMLGHAPRGRIAAADVRALPWRTGTFDVVWCRLVLGHLPALDAAYRELGRVARAGATIVVSDFHPAAARAGHTRSFRDADGAVHAVEHYLHDVDEHVRMAAAAGLEHTALAEPAVGAQVRSHYERAGRLESYAQQLGLPLVLALSFRA